MSLTYKLFKTRYNAILQRLKDKQKTDRILNNSPIFQELVNFCSESENPIYLFGYDNFRNLGDQALWFCLDRLQRNLPSDITIGGLIPNPIVSEGHLYAKQFPTAFRNTTILFPGGGSLGNRYLSSKRRVEFLTTFKPAAIFQMPVSTTFGPEDISTKVDVQNSYESIQKKTLFVRDARSQTEAREQLSLECGLMPDLTDTLPNMSTLHKGGNGVLFLIRKDQESREGVNIAPEAGTLADWDDVPQIQDLRLRLAKWLNRKLASDSIPVKLRYSRVTMRFRLWLVGRIAEVDTARALAFLSVFDQVVTDRLHGVLLSQKLGIPVFMADNDHGKILRYLDTWKMSADGSSPVNRYNSLQDAVNAVNP